MVSNSASVVHHVNEATYTAVGLPSLGSSPAVVVVAGDAERGGAVATFTVGRVTVRVVVVVVATGFVAGTSSSALVIVSHSFPLIRTRFIRVRSFVRSFASKV